MRILIVILMFVLAAGVNPAWADQHEKKEQRKSGSVQQMAPGRLAPDSQRAGISNRRAAALVKQQYTASRIIGVALLDDTGPPVYRVRTLSPKGVVRSVFVDGNTGEVFE